MLRWLRLGKAESWWDFFGMSRGLGSPDVILAPYARKIMVLQPGTNTRARRLHTTTMIHLQGNRSSHQLPLCDSNILVVPQSRVELGVLCEGSQLRMVVLMSSQDAQSGTGRLEA